MGSNVKIKNFIIIIIFISNTNMLITWLFNYTYGKIYNLNYFIILQVYFILFYYYTSLVTFHLYILLLSWTPIP